MQFYIKILLIFLVLGGLSVIAYFIINKHNYYDRVIGQFDLELQDAQVLVRESLLNGNINLPTDPEQDRNMVVKLSLEKHVFGGDYSLMVSDRSPEIFTLLLENIPYKYCEKLVHRKYDNVISDGEPYPWNSKNECEKGNNTLAFTFEL